jgi:pilus assembly protein Flp/PilA
MIWKRRSGNWPPFLFKIEFMTMKKISKIFANEQGATAIEYGLLAALISVVAILAMGSLGDNLMGTMGDVNCAINRTDRAGFNECVDDSFERRDEGLQRAQDDRAAGRG